MLIIRTIHVKYLLIADSLNTLAPKFPLRDIWQFGKRKILQFTVVNVECFVRFGER